MRLSEFIEDHHDAIVADWIAFARTLRPWSDGMTDKDLRDHAEELLTAVVRDMDSPQTGREQSEKSQGLAAEGDLGLVGHQHAAERLKTGFKLDELVAEYRALRASVLRLWGEEHGDKDGEITRFNEAIDETLGEAAAWYSAQLTQTREEFLGILGHDLRNPLGAIVAGAAALTRAESIGDPQLRVAARILSSANRMTRMVNDLLDFTRARLGGGIPMALSSVDLTLLCEQVIAELEAAHPERVVRFTASGAVVGNWDADRLTQVVSNLVANALRHGRQDGDVRVVAQRVGDDVVLRVSNDGEPIPRDIADHIFDPMVRRQTPNGHGRSEGLGLGLYIAREIVVAHHGAIGVTSTAEAGTTFTVTLPAGVPKVVEPQAPPFEQHA